MSEETKRSVVFWSGGADSTLVLLRAAKNASMHWPTRALSVSSHPFINAELFYLQQRAQENFLEHANDLGLHIDHEELDIETSVAYPRHENFQQALLWLSALAPYIDPKDEQLCLGYIVSDQYWHYRARYERLIEEMVPSLRVRYPLEWTWKFEVLDSLKNEGVPSTCWWSCETPITISFPSGTEYKPCGKCNKCLEIVLANTERKFRTRGTRGKLDV